VLIYAENITPRLTYTLDFIFKEVIGIDYFLTDDKISFAQSNQQAKICYHANDLGGVHIVPHGLLYETTIGIHSIESGKWGDITTIFHTEKASIPFDLFSAVFYLTSRYEEYLPLQKDEHGRFKAEHSVAYKYGFLDKPIIHIWCEKLAHELGKTNLKGAFSSIVTFDIDNSYAYRGKGLKRFILSTFRDILQLKLKALFTRCKALINIQHDPCNTYHYIFESFKKYNVQRSIFFFLNGAYSSMDKNLPISSPLQQALIKQCKAHAEIGIHPSYVSNKNTNTLSEEISSLEKVVEQPIIKSRQHFLMLDFPNTYRQLIANNIVQDYTLGYSETLGFRASTCTPFYWFDLDKNEKTTLKIYPLGLMDGTLKEYLQLTTTDAITHAKQHIDWFKKYNGTFVLLWHNSSFNALEGWKNWNTVYEEILHYLNENSAS
jgi:hypothetical protein